MQCRGQITVFFSLILLLILSLAGTCLESARAAGLRYRIRLAADSALQSVFAEYDSSLFQSYGLLFYASVDRSGSDLPDKILEYAGFAGEVGKGRIGTGTDWFAFAPRAASVSELVLATDQNGTVFRQAVLDQMKIEGISIVLSELTDHLGITDSQGDLTETGRKLQEEDTEEDLTVGKILSGYEDLEEQLNELTEAINEEELPQETPLQEESGGFSLKEIIQKVKALFQYGLLAVLVDNPEELSKGTISGEGLPSQLSPEEKARSSPLNTEASEHSDMIGRLLFQEYLLRHFDCYTSGKDGGRYELEYILVGKSTDEKNLRSVVNRLLWMRMGMNLAYLITDSAKRSEAQELAVRLTGWTGIAPLISAAFGLILTVWSLGESLADVRTLLDGGRIPLRKDQDSWTLSLRNLLSFSTAFTSSAKEEEKGLSYEDYLRILLTFSDLKDISYRAMDWIQIHLQEKNPAFQMSACIYSAEILLEAEAEELFLPAFPMTPRNGGYQYQQKTRYQY